MLFGSFVNLQINLILTRYHVKRVVCGTRTTNRKPGNFALNQLENREIYRLSRFSIKFKSAQWISRSSDRNYDYPTQ